MNAAFQFHRLNPAGIQKAKEIAEKFDALLTGIEALCHAGRELAITKTKLEEACFFAKKAMACDPTNQEQS